MSAVKKNKIQTEDFNFGPWSILARTGPILTSAQDEEVRTQLDIPALPEMCFGETTLQINHSLGFSMVFNGIDALKMVDNKHDKMKVAYASDWQDQRMNVEVSKEVVNPFDWTYTTNYSGTITNPNLVTITPTTDRIDIEKLKKHERIHFYQSMVLFEDELADNGIAKLIVKMRVMPSSFFVLLRFFLRVDGVLVRVNDTRVYHEAGSNCILKEWSSKEKKVKDMMNPHADESVVSEQLDLVEESITKIEFNESDGGT